MHPTASQAIPWFGSVLAEIILLAAMLRRRLAGRFPFFFASIAYDVARQAVLFVIFAKFAAAYFAAYWLSIPAEYTLAYAVIYEAFRHAFKADIRFCPKTLKMFAIATAVLVLISAWFIFRPGVPLRNFDILIAVLDRSSELLRCSLLLFLCVCLQARNFLEAPCLGHRVWPRYVFRHRTDCCNGRCGNRPNVRQLAGSNSPLCLPRCNHHLASLSLAR